MMEFVFKAALLGACLISFATALYMAVMLWRIVVEVL